jgi:hypothetical protein
LISESGHHESPHHQLAGLRRLTVFVYIMYGRTSVLLAMKPENRLDHLAERTRALLRFGLGQKRMVDPESGRRAWRTFSSSWPSWCWPFAP